MTRLNVRACAYQVRDASYGLATIGLGGRLGRGVSVVKEFRLPRSSPLKIGAREIRGREIGILERGQGEIGTLKICPA